MRLVAKIVGGLLILAGAYLLLTGLNVLHVGAMSGQVRWMGWGAWALAFGGGFVVWSIRQQPKT